MRMLIAPPHIACLSNHPLLVIHLTALYLTCGLTLYLCVSCCKQLEQYGLSKLIKKGTEWVIFSRLNRRAGVKVIIARKSTPWFADKSRRRIGEDNAAAFIKIYDTHARTPTPTDSADPLLDQSTQRFTYCTLRHAYTLIRREGLVHGICWMMVDETHLLDRRSERDLCVRKNHDEGS